MIDLNTQFTILRANNYIMINQSDVDNIKQTKYETSHCKYLKALRGQKRAKCFSFLSMEMGIYYYLDIFKSQPLYSSMQLK